MATFYLNTNVASVERIAKEFAANKAQVERAAKRAIRKLARWIKSVSLREASRDTGVKRKVLKRRLLMGVQGNQMTARVWYGLNAIPLSAMDPKQTRTGVTAGPVDRRHAFIVKHGGKKQVYRRVKPKGRLPIGHQYHNIAAEMKRIIRSDVDPRFAPVFIKYFEQELRWETRKKA